jgi:hypothetical protein
MKRRKKGSSSSSPILSPLFPVTLKLLGNPSNLPPSTSSGQVCQREEMIVPPFEKGGFYGDSLDFIGFEIIFSQT